MYNATLSTAARTVQPTTENQLFEKNMASSTAESYDEIPYESGAFFFTHPSQLALMAHLLGLSVTPLQSARVLELGSARGENLIPMAMSAPQTHFTGVDISPRQVALAQQHAKQLGLTNTTFHALDLCAITPDFGTFDYIICHGVYSWVPDTVRDRIIDICKQNLAENGLAYVSYNTYPGWHFRQTIRDIMCYPTRAITDNRKRMQTARGYLQFLTQMSEKLCEVNKTFFPNLMRNLLHEENDLVCSHNDSYLFHDHMETNNHPVYFFQFADHLANKGLRYIADVEFDPFAFGSFSQELQAELRRVSPDWLALEQHTDMLRCRLFRRSLIGHPHLKPDRQGVLARTQNLWISAYLTPDVENFDPCDQKRVRFTSPTGDSLASDDPVFKVAAKILREAWPNSLSISAIWEQIQQILPIPDEQKASEFDDLLIAMLRCFLSDHAILNVFPPRVFAGISARPVADPFARILAQEGNSRVTTLMHKTINVDDIKRQLITLLDGTRDREEILGLWCAAAANGEIELNEDNKPITDPARMRQHLEILLNEKLRELYMSQLLIA